MRRHLKKHHHPFLGVVIAFLLFFTSVGAILAAANRTLTQQEIDNDQLASYGIVRSK